MSQSLEELRAAHQVEGATWHEGDGGLPVLVVQNEQCQARVFAYGAHVASWIPAGHEEVLFMSQKSAFAPGKAIRGGVPICWPWFGPKHDDAKAPAHGFARNRAWEVERVSLEDNGRVRVELRLDLDGLDEETSERFPYACDVRHVVSIGQVLSMSLVMRNTGEESFEFEEALHTYLQVGDVATARLHGLESTRYLDKVAGRKEEREGREPFALSAETDRIYLGTRAEVVVEDRGLMRNIRVEKSGSSTTVVWNPWLVKATAMADLGGDAWRRFVCVETCNVRPQQVPLPPGAMHTMTARIRVDRLI